MITITIPAWLVWTMLVLWLVDVGVKAVLIVVTRLNNQASRSLIVKLAEMAILRAIKENTND